MNILIRQLKHSDNKNIISLILDILNGEYEMNLNLVDLPDLCNSYNTYIESRVGNFWVAEINNEIVGTLAILKLRNHDYEVRRMYTKYDYRGNGIAQKLMNELFNWCYSNNVHYLYLETNEKWKSAHHIYKKLGFHLISRDMLPDEFPIVKVATHFLKKRIIAQQGDAPETVSP